MKRFISSGLCFMMAAVLVFGQTRTHTVAKGETLATIAAQYSVTKEALEQANPSARSFIYVGMKLTIPDTSVAPVAETPTPTSTAAAGGRSLSASRLKGIVSAIPWDRIPVLAAKYADREAGGYLFFFQGGFGLGLQVSPFEGIPAGATLEYWKARKGRNVSFSVDLMPRIPLALDGDLAIRPVLGIGYHTFSYPETDSRKGLFIHLHPQVSYVLPILDGSLNVHIGWLYCTYNNNIGNPTIGASYAF